MKEISSFYQTAPELPNPWAADPFLQQALRARVSDQEWQAFSKELSAFAARVVPEIDPLGLQAEREAPRLVHYSAWGKRIDEIETSRAWSELDALSAREGMIAIGYERKYGASSRLLQFAKLALFHPASGFYTCPLAMTDGAARVVELSGDEKLKANAFRHLTSREPNEFWTSGQWMTERTGGSDVSGTSVVAKQEGGEWRLYGDKWFTSATTSQMSLVLARVEQGDQKGLALFYVELRGADGRLQGIQVNRLKDKLGTKALPTAELTLNGLRGVLIGKVGEGVKRAAGILNITRLYNSICCVGAIARGVQLMTSYSKVRHAFGRLIAEQPLHLETLASLRARSAAVTELVFHVVHLLGKEECGQASKDELALLRILTPVTKLYTAREAIHNASETIEGFGGAGYIEDTGIPKLLRDAQVFPIWEGTTNVLSLDTLRAMAKDGAFEPLVKDLGARLQAVKSADLRPLLERVSRRLQTLVKHAQSKATASSDDQQRSAREFAIGLAETVAATLLLERANQEAATAGGLGLARLAASRYVGIVGDWTPKESDVGAIDLTSVKILSGV